MTIDINSKKLDIDLEKTREYSSAHSLCDCLDCRNFYAQIKDKYPRLTEFLAQLGLDAARPDETSCIDAVDNIADYLEVWYTVCGKIIETDGEEIYIDDSTALSIVIEERYVPNEQPNDDYFTVTVYGIELPYILD